MEEKKFFIPEMEQAEIVKWYQNISPIVIHNDKPCYLRRLSDKEISNTAYTWLNNKNDFGKEVDYTKLEELCVLNMLHTFGYYGFFKPTVAEVIRQIPKELLSEVVAFEMISNPNDADDLSKFQDALNAGFHVSTVRLYKTKN